MIRFEMIRPEHRAHWMSKLLWDKHAVMWIQIVGLEPGLNPREATGIKKDTGIHHLGNQGSIVRIPA